MMFSDLSSTTSTLVKDARILHGESGATAIGRVWSVAALISVMIITGLKLVGTNLNTTFNTVATAVK
jgi:Flp pilus assembly pilin Flp